MDEVMTDLNVLRKLSIKVRVARRYVCAAQNNAASVPIDIIALDDVMRRCGALRRGVEMKAIVPIVMNLVGPYCAALTTQIEAVGELSVKPIVVDLVELDDAAECLVSFGYPRPVVMYV